MNEMSRSKQLAGLAGWLVLTFIAAAIGAAASRNSASFYQLLDRPGWAPPPWIFGPVWTVLYLLIGMAAWLVWRERGFTAARSALALYIAQLAANALWTWLFFAWQRGALAFGEIIVLWVLIIATMLAFWRVKPLAGWLFVPYLLWVTYAAALTYSVWQRNPSAL